MRRGLSRTSGRRSRLSFGRLINYPQHFAHAHVFASLVIDTGQDPRTLGADLQIDLFGLKFNDGLTGGDALAGLLEPAANGGFDDRFAKLRDDDVGGHKVDS
jgi:hypothetical protein